MANYIVDPTNPLEPAQSRGAKQGAEELRALKALIKTLLKNIICWNPADISPYIILSGLNLIATKINLVAPPIVDVAYHAVRANTPINSGKIYWEITLNLAGGILPIFGVGTINATLENYVGSDVFGFGYGGPLGNRYNAGASVAFGAPFAVNDTLGFALDISVPQLQIFKNNVSQGIIALTAGQSWYPMASMASNGEQNTVNFGDQAFKYSPPAGFISIVSTISAIKQYFVQQFFPTF